MPQPRHWLFGSSFLPLFQEAIQNVERNLTDRLDREGEIERPEESITIILQESLRNSLNSIQAGLRDLQQARQNQPSVSRFDFTICDMQDANKDVYGADIAFIFRTNWPSEFVTRRGILVQAKRLGPVSPRTINRLDRQSRRLYGCSLEDLDELAFRFLRRRPLSPVLSRARVPWPYWPALLPGIPETVVLGDFQISEPQLNELLEVVSSYYLFYDYPVPHLTLPCVQALTVQGLVNGAGSPDLYRAAVLRHSMSLTHLLVDQLVGCHIGEWNGRFEQLEHVADQSRVGKVQTSKGDFNVHAYNVRFVVIIEITLLPGPYEAKE